jgi:hypothetical protein
MMKKLICLGFMLAVTSSLAYCGYLMADDAMGTSSFNTAGHWDDGMPPLPGMPYITQGYLLRTPNVNIDGYYNFEGDLLIVGQGDGGGANPFLTDGSVNNNALINKTPGNPVINVNDLVLDGGTIRDGMGSTDAWALVGNIYVASVGGLAAQSRFDIMSTINGSGPLYIATNGNGDAARTIYIYSPFNTYNGSIFMRGADAAHCRLTFSEGSRMNFTIWESGLCNNISGTGTATFDGVFSFDLWNAGTNVGDSWSLTSVSSQTFGSTFSVEGFDNMGGGIWTTNFNGTHYQFNTNTGVLSAWLGGGIPADPYQIWTLQEMNAIGTNSSNWDKCYKLMADIDMSALLRTPYNIIGNEAAPFTGTFDGNGHVIRNLTYTHSGGGYVGLFGYTGSSSFIQNLGVEDAAISGSVAVTGVLAGRNSGIIQSCYVTGSVSSSVDLGGMAGRNMGTISFCHANVSVNGANGIGGLVGYNPGSISNCYATGAVTGNDYVGGLVAFHDGPQLSNCYATGTVTGTGNVGGLVGFLYTSITASFWDTQTSGTTDGVGNQDPDPSGAAGKTTAQMKAVSTFTAAGWDFVNVWDIINLQTYPLLRTFSDINPADLNFSGTVDLEDLAILAANWLK